MRRRREEGCGMEGREGEMNTYCTVDRAIDRMGAHMVTIVTVLMV